MASNLFAKEEEYRKLNDELQQRNKKLMEEFDTVMKKQDELLRESQEIPKFDRIKLRNKLLTEDVAVWIPSRIGSIDVQMKENCENLQIDDCIPSSVDEMGIRGMTQFYRAKIKAMKNEYQQLQVEFTNKNEELKKVNKDNQKLMEEKDKWFQAYNTSKNSISKLENQITTLNLKCQFKDNESVSLKKEIEQLKKELKSTSLNYSGYEVRLNRALEDNEKLKTTLKTAKQEEKDLKDAHKKEVSEITVAAKRLEKQKTELLTTFKKQLQLIDNLKKQKAFLEATKLTHISENEFVRILDWKID